MKIKRNWIVVIIIFLCLVPLTLISFKMIRERARWKYVAELDGKQYNPRKDKKTLISILKSEDENGRFNLYVDNELFPVKGVTFSIDVNAKNVDAYMEDVKNMGANCIRTWECSEKNTPIILDAAQRHGLKVMLGLRLRHKRSGGEGDDKFNYAKNIEGKKAQYDEIMKWVKKLKDHPALLMWGVRNEVILTTVTEDEKVAYAKFLEEVLQGIKKIDNVHPLVSVSAWSFSWPYWTKYCPSLDIYGTNAYGAIAAYITTEWRNHCPPEKPYLITEFGVRGEWGVPKDKNGLKIEPTDKEKYDAIVTGWEEWIKPKPQCLGVYIFNYDNLKDHAAVWLSMKIEEKFRPQYWATRRAFLEIEPANYMPSINEFTLPVDHGKPGEWMKIILKASDNEDNALTPSFYYNKREGSREKRGSILPLEFQGDFSSGFKFKVPEESGVVKVYAFVADTYPNLSIGQTSFIVDGNESTEPVER